MTTSGTYGFLMNRDSIIAAALRTMEVVGVGETIDPLHITNCAEALNLMVKGMVLEGMPLWCVQELVVPLVAGQAAYSVGAATAQPRPLRVLQAVVRNSTGQDTELQLVSRFEYNTLGSKANKGQPNQLMYDPQLLTGIVTLYTVPADALSSLRLTIQRQIQDFNLSTDNPDFPQEAYQMLKWCLVDELSLEYGAKMSVVQVAAGKAITYKTAFMAFEQEQVSQYFVPSGRVA